MQLIRAGRSGLLAALCAAVLSTAAFAAGTVRDETTLLVRTSAGAIERLKYEGELADGERRALTTETGNPATLSRSGEGMLLELAGERFEVKLPKVGVDAAGTTDVAAGEGKRHVVIHRHEDKAVAADGGGESSSTESRKVVKILRKGEPGSGDAHAGGVEAEALAMAMAMGADDPELMLLDGTGPKVLVMRRIVREDATP